MNFDYDRLLIKTFTKVNDLDASSTTGVSYENTQQRHHCKNVLRLQSNRGQHLNDDRQAITTLLWNVELCGILYIFIKHPTHHFIGLIPNYPSESSHATSSTQPKPFLMHHSYCTNQKGMPTGFMWSP